MNMGADSGIEITQEQWFVLNKLAQADGSSQVDLTEDIFADRPNLTRILATMERRGLVRRVADPEDGRRMRVYLTDDGRKMENGFSEIARRERRRLFAGISKEDLETTKRVLARIEENATF